MVQEPSEAEKENDELRQIILEMCDRFPDKFGTLLFSERNVALQDPNMLLVHHVNGMVVLRVFCKVEPLTEVVE